jgi:diguanylate cyclase (GGDEF)-like protein
MSNQSSAARGRTLLAGKIVSNYGQSSINCTVRRMSAEGATLEVESVHGVPEQFHLLVAKEGKPRGCKRVWQSGREVGIVFEGTNADAADVVERAKTAPARSDSDPLRGQLYALRASLDEIEVGTLMLGADMKAQFINRAFRRMWNLPDAVADRHPAFVALMYHGRDTNAYNIGSDNLDAYIAERARLVTEGDPTPQDLRRSDGRIFRMQCAVLPNGGRMISYTNISDVIKHSDELEILRDSIEHLQDGIVLLDRDLNVRFLNGKMRTFWEISDELAASNPSYASLIASARHAVEPGLPRSKLEAFFTERVAEVKAGANVRDLQTPDGRRIRARCTPLTGGGRMLTYCDITDLTKAAEQLQTLATVDAMTGLYNRRHFLECAEAEWSRYQRYQRPLTVLMIDIDHFKSVNDRYGHAVGDRAIAAVAEACKARKRKSDIVGRLGGDELAVLLPETDMNQARVVAERIRRKIAAITLVVHKVEFRLSASLGIAEATLSMSGIDALLHAADQALYRAKANGRNCACPWVAPVEELKLAAE